MTFYDYYSRHRNLSFDSTTAAVDDRRIERALTQTWPAMDDFAALLSDRAANYLEPMAQRAAAVTRRHFGNVVFLFTPMYISNYCENRCPYCSFSARNSIRRHQLTLDEVRNEAEAISRSGIRHILVLTGSARRKASVEYISRSVSIIAESFSAIGIEVYSMTEPEYEALIQAGVDSLTIYQEVYNRRRYEELHTGGPKADYRFRLEAPERAARRGMRQLTIGPLLGLHDFRQEAYATALHLRYLQQNFPEVELSVSLPRIRPLLGSFEPESPVSDRRFVQLLTAFRLLFPTVGITVSTRESQQMRDGVLPLGVTKMSAGVSTAVGGHSGDKSETQFEISDGRGVEELKNHLQARGFQPVMHDWHTRLSGLAG